MATIANKSYLKRMFNDTQQAGAGLRINMKETLDDMFVVICDIYFFFMIDRNTYISKDYGTSGIY